MPLDNGVKTRGRPPGSKNKPREEQQPIPFDQFGKLRRGRNGAADRPQYTPEELEENFEKGELLGEELLVSKTRQRESAVVIEPPKFEEGYIDIVGVTPYLQNKFSEKARRLMEERQMAGSQGEKSKKRREARDFEESYKLAQHIGRSGRYGIPAPAFRNAMISACKLAGFAMTRAKLSLFVIPDDYDVEDRTPLVFIEGEPQCHQAAARNASGVADIRWRPMWDEWSARVHIRWDADQFSLSDVVNLMVRAGMQVGIGEGRPDSPKSNGLDFGRWEVR